MLLFHLLFSLYWLPIFVKCSATECRLANLKLFELCKTSLQPLLIPGEKIVGDGKDSLITGAIIQPDLPTCLASDHEDTIGSAAIIADTHLALEPVIAKVGVLVSHARVFSQ